MWYNRLPWQQNRPLMTPATTVFRANYLTSRTQQCLVQCSKSSCLPVLSNLRSGPFLASLICSLMSSLAKIGPDQKSLKNSVWSAKFWPTKLVIWLTVETPEVKMPSWLRGALAKSSRLIRHKCTKKFAPFCSYNAVDGATWFYLYKWRYAIWNIS